MTGSATQSPELRPDIESPRAVGRAGKLDRILLATDLSARSDRALARAVALARSHRAHLTVLHIADEELPEAVLSGLLGAAEADIEASLARHRARDVLDIAVCVQPGRDYRDILSIAQADECDLIVLGRHRDETATHRLEGTTMERVLRHGVHPVLVVAERADGPYRKIMVGVDFSVYTRSAVRAALTIAPDAEFLFVHAFQVPFEGFLPGRDIQRELKTEYDAALARIVDEEAAALGSDRSKIRRILRNGDVTGALRAEAAQHRPDLLVVGTHGRAGIAHAVLGSVAETLLNHPPCDVLAVKAW